MGLAAVMAVSAVWVPGFGGQVLAQDIAPVRSSTVIKDPWTWARAYWTKHLGSGGGVLREFHIDLDHDGVPELFVETSAGRGNAGAPSYVFKELKGGFKPLGVLFFPRGLLRVLPAKKGQTRLVIYQRVNCSEGVLAWLRHDGSDFVLTKTEVVHPGDGGTPEGRKRFREVFYPPESRATRRGGD